jgi:hypothetical protein
MVEFKKATRTKKKLRAALIGPAGAGKTRTALRMATGLGGKIALIDSEHGSASMYADFSDFDALELHSFSPDRYIEAIEAAERAGYDVLIVDSLSHAWSGKDGVLEFVDRTKRNGNSYNAWGDATPMQNRLVEKLLTCRMHLIVTLRSKMEYVQEKDERTGKTTIRKVGMQPVQRDGVEFEFDVIADVDQDHRLRVAKTRIDPIKGFETTEAGEDFGRRLRDWLDGGAPEAPMGTAKQKARIMSLLRDLGVEHGKADYVASLNDGAKPSTEADFSRVIGELELRLAAKQRASGAVVDEGASAEG